ncbi:MAG: hypothetical protein CSA15_12360 [Candidatus Delongbacteria bacterium]|nr:MAG: hypothetical protein CSA15_12360 [Candidatus Delongbacteria bacterium]
MKKLLMVLAVLLLVLASFSKTTEVSQGKVTPGKNGFISYQGKIENFNVKELKANKLSVVFRLYDEKGNVVWSEDQNLTTKDGVINTHLGKLSRFNPEIFDENLYLTLEIGGKETDKQLLTGTSYSMVAKRVSKEALVAGDGVEIKKLDDGKLEISSNNTANSKKNMNLKGTKSDLTVNGELHVKGDAIYLGPETSNRNWKILSNNGNFQIWPRTNTGQNLWQKSFVIERNGDIQVRGNAMYLGAKDENRNWKILSSPSGGKLQIWPCTWDGQNLWQKSFVIERDGDIEVRGKGKFQDNIYCKGKISAEEIVVTSSVNFPDYVFGDDYNMKSLDEVESFIEDNGHLPGMPSAKEVTENGMNIKEIQLKLVEKVEELTLHMIELKKENKRLKREIELTKER